MAYPFSPYFRPQKRNAAKAAATVPTKTPTGVRFHALCKYMDVLTIFFTLAATKTRVFEEKGVRCATFRYYF